MSGTIEPPRAEPSADTKPYWDGLARGEILLQRCADCGKFRHYPRPMCDGCFSFAHTWVPASGAASVHSWTVTHHPFHPAFKPLLPYALVTVDLPEGVRAMAPLEGVDPSELRIGIPLRLAVDAATGLPVLRPGGG